MALLGVENKPPKNIEWQEIDTVLLDLDGTLLDLNFDLYFWQQYLPLEYSKKHNITLQQAKDIIIPMLTLETGKLNWYCLDYWQNRLEMDITQLKQNISHLIQVMPHAKDFLTAARAKNKKVVLVTNAHIKSIKIKMAITKLETYFDIIISSHDYGVAKQNQGFWIQLSEQLKLKKERAIFFDDSLDVLTSARDFGIKHIVAINKPSSKKEPKTIPGFFNIIDFSEVLPIKIKVI